VFVVILAPLTVILFMMWHDLEAGLWMLISALVILVPPGLMVAFVKTRQAWGRWRDSGR